jgi:hypothetical protein
MLIGLEGVRESNYSYLPYRPDEFGDLSTTGVHLERARGPLSAGELVGENLVTYVGGFTSLR